MAGKDINPKIKELLESDIFDYLELESIPEEDKAQMMENIMLSLQSRMMLRIADIVEETSPEKFDEFKKLLSDEKVTDQDVAKFLDEMKINLDVIAAEEAILLKAEVMGLKAKAGGADGQKS